jgi:hypothetical protein
MLYGGEGTSNWQETVVAWLKDESLLDREAWKKFFASINKEDQFCPRELY